MVINHHPGPHPLKPGEPNPRGFPTASRVLRAHQVAKSLDIVDAEVAKTTEPWIFPC